MKEDVIVKTTSKITLTDRLRHFLARWGINRGGYRLEPGLYSLGTPDEDSPVFVSANYTLSFDELRSSLKDMDCYILVLDTKGINVWCAAGKGTFGTDELVSRIEAAGLSGIVSHRNLILPQLGAPGVSGFEVKKRSGFRVKFGPVRASDIKEFMQSGKATPEMRRVNFRLRDRLVLIPVELVHVFLPVVLISVLLYFLGGLFASAAVLTSVFAGIVLFPVLLPWLPTPNFSTKGFILGGLTAVLFVLISYAGNPDSSIWFQCCRAVILILTIPPVTAFCALNFTGSTTFTSRTGVKREIFAYVPVMAWMFGCGFLLSVALTIFKWTGGAV